MNKKRTPRQDRSRATIEAILDAAIQILDEHGLEGLKVAPLAERSGFAVGTLYQYFHSLDDLLLALVEQEQQRQQRQLMAKFGHIAVDGGKVTTQDMIQILLATMEYRRLAHKALIEWALTRPDVRALEGRNTLLGQLLASVSSRSRGLNIGRLLTETECFVLSRAVLMTIRSAIWNNERVFGSSLFEQALVDMVDGMVEQIARREAASRDTTPDGGADAH